jgi:2-polyprenyl-3-methyl-5-hydroxy-6-metoxy-1,4-benzoquinol methylase
MDFDDPEQAIRKSWSVNAAAWTAAVRGKRIPSRAAGTDAAIVNACMRLRPRRALDVGCGEGWLARALAQMGVAVLGIDGSCELSAEARGAGGGSFQQLDFSSLVRDPTQAAGPWDVIVCNYVLFTASLAPLLTALGRRLAPAGRLLIQTVHPWTAIGDGAYAPGWREETFAGFGAEFPSPMPWYFRTLQTWSEEVTRADLAIVRIEEPMNRETGKPLSLILECAARPLAWP